MQRQTEEEEAAALDMAVKRHREQEEEEEDAPASIELNAHAEPLTLLTLVKSHFDTLVWAQLCNPQGVALFSFVHLPPRLPRPFAGALVYGMSLTHADWLRAMGSGFKGKLVRLLSLGVGRHFDSQRNWRPCHQMMQSTVRWVASQLFAAARDEAAKEAEELCASGQFAAALVPLQRAIEFADFPSRALKAWLLLDGREGVVKDEQTAFELAEEGASFGCHHCQGVMAFCYAVGSGCKEDRAQSLELARKSSERGSRYGQLTLGLLSLPFGKIWRDESVPFYELATEQGLDEAQFRLGQRFYDRGVCVVDGLDFLKHCGGSSLLPPKDFIVQCSWSLSVTSTVKVFSKTEKQPFDGTGAPKQRAALELKASCGSWARELATVAPSINQLLKLCMFIYIYTCILLLKTTLRHFKCKRQQKISDHMILLQGGRGWRAL